MDRYLQSSKYLLRESWKVYYKLWASVKPIVSVIGVIRKTQPDEVDTKSKRQLWNTEWPKCPWALIFRISARWKCNEYKNSFRSSLLKDVNEKSLPLHLELTEDVINSIFFIEIRFIYCSYMHGGDEKWVQNFGQETQNEDNSEDESTDRKILLEWILGK
jgi:hypothetical protein